MKSLKKLYIFLFVCALIGPGIVFNIVKEHIDTNNYQNRELEKFPDIKLTAFSKLPERIEAYYNDYLPFKNQLTQLNTYIDIGIFHNVDSDSVVLGKENWLFYKKEGSISDYRGVIPISDEEFNNMKNDLLRAKEYFGSRGIEFVVFIAPNKEEIYSQFLPPYINVVDSMSRADKIAAYIEEQLDIKVIYPKKELLEQSEVIQVYKKYDTHWNRAGAFIGAQAFLESMGKKTKILEKVEVVSEGKISGDLANMLGATKFFDDDEDLTVKNEGEAKLLKDISQQYLNYREYESKTGENRIFFLGDSFTNYMMPYVAQEYSFSAQVHLQNYEKGMLEEILPDVVVCELVERSVPYIGSLMRKIIDIEE